MQQVILNVPTEKMPVFRQFLHVSGLENQEVSSSSAISNTFTRELQTPAKFHPYYDWEFFMSELEYE